MRSAEPMSDFEELREPLVRFCRGYLGEHGARRGGFGHAGILA